MKDNESAGTDGPDHDKEERGSVKPVVPNAVVALGASAGGLASLEKFFINLPPDTGMAFVVVVHLDPDRTTILPDLISRYSRMPVAFAEESAPVEANKIYVIPANYDLRISNQHFSLEEMVKPRGVRQTIDTFLVSLAEDLREHAIGIILSGSGSDGTEGIKAIKGEGGIVLAESDSSASYQSMPQSAIATGLVDVVMPAEKMPEMLISIGPTVRAHAELLQHSTAISEADLNTICRIVKEATGNDLQCYKVNTIVRRIYRRMVVNGIRDRQHYLELLKTDTDESLALAKEVLIGVTSFFRDPEAFAELERLVLPVIFNKHRADNPVRIWLAGCSTGEEAYTVAILVYEFMQRHGIFQPVKIFASDLDMRAIDYARKGLYSIGIRQHLSPQRLDEHFIRKSGQYEVKKYLRDMIVFAQHNLIRDPPFSKLDLLVCRNVLIYLNATVQKKLLPLFHQGLNPGGCLFIGPSETVGSSSELFAALSGKWKIYKRKDLNQRLSVDFPSDSTTYDQSERFDSDSALAKYIKPGSVLEKLLVERYAPPSMLLNEKYDVLYFSTKANRYLVIPKGEPTPNLLKLARDEIRPALRAALHKAQKEEADVTYEYTLVTIDGKQEQLSIHVEPLTAPAALKGLVVVILEPTPIMADTSEAQTDLGRDKDQIIFQLDEQLRITHDELQETISRLANSNDELKNSNEELMSMNEEFQSTNEELETSKEELQALNEELSTVNSELEAKVEALNQANNDINNLLNCSDIATLFLDRELRVKLYTPASTQLYNLIPADIGRPFAHLSGRISDQQLGADARKVLNTLQPVEREIVTKDHNHYLVRVLPYRTAADVIDGVVLTFTDITYRHNAERERAQLAAIVETTSDAIIGQTLDGEVTSWNEGAENLYGYMAAEMVGQNISKIIPPERRHEISVITDKIRHGEKVSRIETERWGKDRNVIPVSLSLTPIFNAVREVVACASIAHDISEERRQQQLLIESEELQRLRAEELAALMDAVPAAVFMTRDAHTTTIEANQAGQALLNLSSGDCIVDQVFDDQQTKNFKVFSGGQELRRGEFPLEKVAATGEQLSNVEEDLVFEDGSKISLFGNIVPLKNSVNEPRGALAVFLDISNRVKMERELAEHKEIMRLFIEHAPVALAMFDTDMKYLAVSQRWRCDYGLNEVVLEGVSYYQIFPDIPDEWRQAHLRGMRGEFIHSEGDRFVRADGQVQWIRWEIHPWFTGAEDVGGIILFTEDITAIKLAQEAVLRREKELEAIFNQAAVGMAKIGKDGSWQRVNGRVCDMLGYSREELEQLTFQDITYPEDLDIDLGHFRGVIAGDIETYSMEKRYVRKDKSLLWINLTVSAVRDSADGQVEFFISIIENIDQRKKAEKRHAELEAELRQKYKMEAIGIMSGGISHNFNNSLSVILGNVEMAKLRLAGQEDVGSYLDKAKLAIMRTRNLIDQVMLYSHKKSNVKTALNLNQIMDETIVFLRSILPSSIRLAYQVRNPQQQLTINASASSIQEAMLNLANNASYAMEEKGDLKIILDVATLEEEDIPVLFKDGCRPGVFARIAFQDTGCGIPVEIMDQIFDPFFTTKGLSEGTGIGLSTVMGFVKNSGGVIEVSSELGYGTQFELYFPLLGQKLLSEGVESHDIQYGKERILYVDDDESLANVNEMMLASLGYQVTATTNSLEAFALIQRNSADFELLIVDQTMPDMTGVELFSALKEKGIVLPTILCTGYSSKVSEAKAKEMGIDAFCTKPLNLAELAQIIRTVLDKST